MSECIPERMSEYRFNIYFQMVCQKLCQNNVSGWGSLEDSKKVIGRRYKFPFAGGAIGNSPFSTGTVNLPNYQVYDFSTFW